VRIVGQKWVSMIGEGGGEGENVDGGCEGDGLGKAGERER
jgi:hypothetical protein